MTTRQRTVRLAETDAGLALVIRERKGQGAWKVDCYFLSRVEGGYRLAKHEGTKHVVCLSGGAAPCDCLGHKHYGHKTVCRHVAALQRLIALGKLPAVESVCETCGGNGGPRTGDADSDGTACRACGQ